MWCYFGRNVWDTKPPFYLNKGNICSPPPPHAKNNDETQKSNLVWASLSIMDLI